MGTFDVTLLRGNAPEVANVINKIPNITLDEAVTRMKTTFPDYNDNYDILTGKPRINDFDNFIKKYLKSIELFQKTVDTAVEKKENEKRKYVELINGFADYEKNSILNYTEGKIENLIFNNPSFTELTEKVKKLTKEMINPFTAFKDWLEEEVLDAEAMSIAIKGINDIIEKDDKCRQKLYNLEQDIKKVESGGSSLKTLFKKKDSVIANILK